MKTTFTIALITLAASIAAPLLAQTSEEKPPDVVFEDPENLFPSAEEQGGKIEKQRDNYLEKRKKEKIRGRGLWGAIRTAHILAGPRLLLDVEHSIPDCISGLVKLAFLLLRKYLPRPRGTLLYRGGPISQQILYANSFGKIEIPSMKKFLAVMLYKHFKRLLTIKCSP